MNRQKSYRCKEWEAKECADLVSENEGLITPASKRAKGEGFQELIQPGKKKRGMIPLRKNHRRGTSVRGGGSKGKKQTNGLMDTESRQEKQAAPGICPRTQDQMGKLKPSCPLRG